MHYLINYTDVLFFKDFYLNWEVGVFYGRPLLHGSYFYCLSVKNWKRVSLVSYGLILYGIYGLIVTISLGSTT